MSKTPEAMRRNGRNVVPHFDDDEHLFRRVPLSCWDDPDERPGVDAVELPDMSVGRSKYGHAEWVRFDVVNGRHYSDWGVISFKVGDVPPSYWDLGIYQFTFRAVHSPLDNDYPHSEVQVKKNGSHVLLAAELPEDVHLKWRIALLGHMTAVIRPSQIVRIRSNPPISHRLEPHSVIS